MSKPAGIFDFHTVEYERVLLELIAITFKVELSGAVFRYRPERVFQHSVERHLSQLDMLVWGKKVETMDLSRELVPLTWVDAIKLRWLPKWMLSRFPAREREIVTTRRYVYNVCPHLPARPGEEHADYLVRKREQA